MSFKYCLISWFIKSENLFHGFWYMLIIYLYWPIFWRIICAPYLCSAHSALLYLESLNHGFLEIINSHNRLQLDSLPLHLLRLWNLWTNFFWKMIFADVIENKEWSKLIFAKGFKSYFNCVRSRRNLTDRLTFHKSKNTKMTGFWKRQILCYGDVA